MICLSALKSRGFFSLKVAKAIDFLGIYRPNQKQDELENSQSAEMP
jgi:hypothetical protein